VRAARAHPGRGRPGAAREGARSQGGRLTRPPPPFPGTRGGKPFGTFALLWSLPEDRRREIAWVELGDDATLTARGRQWCEGETAYVLDYELETSPGYVTERLRAGIAGGPELDLARGKSPELEGLLDCDLGFSPLTNAMPVLRDRLHESGEACAIDVAWVAVPGLTVHRDHQIYEPASPGRVRFLAPDSGFERVIELTPDGFVRDYPDIAQLRGRIVREPVA
jgi:uncharacterized protein